MTCLPCARDFHSECGLPCCCKPITEVKVETTEVTEKRSVGRPQQEVIKTSAGRKRAASLYEIEPEADCEWKWRANCGGGKKPIVGCLNGKQSHRHHGPVKDTSHNERTNIHLICANCHNTWHAVNDPIYNEEEYATLPHSPRPALPDDLIKASDV